MAWPFRPDCELRDHLRLPQFIQRAAVLAQKPREDLVGVLARDPVDV